MRILHSRKLIFVSKPRCGSTSIRDFLTKKMKPGDVACDVPNHKEGLHPHMSAPSIYAYLKRNEINPEEYKTFTVTRNPIDMLWSYYKYFTPDINCRYNYETKHLNNNLIDFDDWLKIGRVGIGKYWSEFVPRFVSDKDFSPLSLEAHICDINGKVVVDNWFKLEELEYCIDWLSDLFGEKVNIDKVNGSRSDRIPIVDASIKRTLSSQFPLESVVYDI